MSNYEKKIKKNIERNNQKTKPDPNKKQITNLIKIFIVIIIVIAILFLITYFTQNN